MPTDALSRPAPAAPPPEAAPQPDLWARAGLLALTLSGLCWLPALVLVQAALVSGCAAVQPARLALPGDLAQRTEALELRGLGASTRGSAPLLGRDLSFERGASRLSLFDGLAVTDRSTLRWTLGPDDPLRGECLARRRVHGLGVVEVVGRPLTIDCRFAPADGQLQLGEVRGAVGLASERRGTLRAGSARWTVRSVHRAQGAAFDLAQPLGYLVEDGDQAIAAVALQGTRPVLHLPRADDPRRQQVLPALVSLALLWDEAAP